MANLLLAIYLIVIGLIHFGLAVPTWVAGVLAIAAGVMLLAARFGAGAPRRIT